MKKQLVMTPLEGYPTDIGVWLWALQEPRTGLKNSVRDLPQNVLDWAGPDNNENSIGSLLYHIAAVEISWLFIDMLQQPNLISRTLFPFEPFTQGRITRITGIPADEHLARLNESRRIFLKHMKTITLKDWMQTRTPQNEDYAVTPAWIVFHLIEHEAGHAAQINTMKKRAHTHIT